MLCFYNIPVVKLHDVINLKTLTMLYKANKNVTTQKYSKVISDRSTTRRNRIIILTSISQNKCK